MTKIEKFEHLKSFLRENGIDFVEKHVSGTGVVIDLRVKKYNIAVHLSDEHDQEFYMKLRKLYHPFFIREEESPEFIIEKMQNCILDIMNGRQRKFEKSSQPAAKSDPEKPKRKRQRIIKAEKV